VKTVHSQRLAAFLMARGFVLIRTEPDKRGTDRNVFIFHASAELEAAITVYLNQR
jgi:hypothetical protein